MVGNSKALINMLDKMIKAMETGVLEGSICVFLVEDSTENNGISSSVGAGLAVVVIVIRCSNYVFLPYAGITVSFMRNWSHWSWNDKKWGW